MTRRCWPYCLATAVCLTAGCGPADTVTIQGYGATLPSPLYERWFLEFYLLHPSVRVNYQAVGSSAGVQQFENELAHFGATDEALDKSRLEKIAQKLGIHEVIQIPMTAGSVALCYNLPDLPKSAHLNLTRKALVDVLLGDLTYWDDERIQAANPGLRLPHLQITFIRRAEGSGTTFVFTNHLNEIDPRWRKDSKDPRWSGKGGPGKGKTVQWPVHFIGGKGSAGVAALIQQTPGALGYVEAGFAELTNMPIAALQNQQLKFVQPNAATCKKALENARPDAAAIALPAADPASADAYPIVTFTWIICRKNYPDDRVAGHLKEVLSYCLGKGQELSEQLGYVPLPDAVLEKARQKVAEIGAR
jgi:phosphate transport system substrate-binding protein